jgi:RNA polymerase sigma factor (sigma-70 family)
VNSARRSLLLSFGGRSSLATWLRAVLCQRFVDRVRAQRRLEPLPVEDDADPGRVGLQNLAEPVDPDRARYLELVTLALSRAVGQLSSRDRLRLSYYYVQGLTLAEIGRLARESEATVSRQLARTRRSVRAAVERELRDDAGLTEAQVAECFASVAADPGPLDVQPLLVGASAERETAPERSA